MKILVITLSGYFLSVRVIICGVVSLCIGVRVYCLLFTTALFTVQLLKYYYALSAIALTTVFLRFYYKLSLK